MSGIPMVSVVMITYGHEKYIRQAIEGVLIQECNFEIEFLIANDCSPDSTDEIINEILKKDVRAFSINYIKHEKNIGMMPNFIFALQKAKGKYIALCEGDDYWTDPHKLQKQIEFLEVNPDYAGCFHKTKALIKESFFDDSEIEKRFEAVENKEKITRLDLLKQGNFVHTCSLVCRNFIFNMTPELKRSPVGDYLLFLEVTGNGYLKRLEDYMGVYRRGVGVYSTLSSFEMGKKMLQYRMCVLSLLKDENEREIYLDSCLKQLDSYEKLLLNGKSSFFRKKMSHLKKLFLKAIKIN